MTTPQILISIELVIVLIMFAWGKWRHDLVAIFALITGVILGLIPTDSAFSGFGHPAVITVAAVLVVSHALKNSGVVDLAARHLGPLTKHPTIHIAALTGVVTIASAFMNNVGALALLLPVALATAREHKRSPALLLMPLAFGSILGGMTTMIGTPPNIIVATYRTDLVGTPFNLFDFAPVGVLVALTGVIFVVLIGWRLIPKDRLEHVPEEQLFEIGKYLTELRIPEGSELVGKTPKDIEPLENGDIELNGLARPRSVAKSIPDKHIFTAEDILVVQGQPDDFKPLLDKYGLELVTTATAAFEAGTSDELRFVEGIVTKGTSLNGRDVNYLRRRTAGTVAVAGLARQGKTLRKRLRRVIFKTGDVLLLHGDAENLDQQILDLGLLPLAPRDLAFVQPQRTIIAVSIFFAAILLALTDLLPLSISFLLAIMVYILLGIMPLRDLYSEIDWPVIVLLGAMIPVGHALETTETTTLLASWITSSTDGLPVFLIIALVLTVTMFLSDIINNAATVLVMAPISVGIAEAIGAAMDPFLMAVAVGASCAFLTPIGHQSNTLVMGPGGYRFGDYWRMGLPLEILIVVISVPAIMLFWPPF